jgi:L-alanine-DL-glutamate epimerase-like enolase superfamily enzyme
VRWPKPCPTAGLTEAWRIAWMAYEQNIQWVPHGWNTAMGLAADLQLSSA